MYKKINKQKVYTWLMKALIAHFFLFFSIFSFANTLSSTGQSILQKRVSMSVENMRIKDVLKKIEETDSVQFAYLANPFNFEKQVSLSIEDSPLVEVLGMLFDGHATFEDRGDVVVIKPANDDETSMIEVNGKVTDEKGEPIPGVNVVVKGTALGTVTDADGRYSLSVGNPDAILVFTFVGYVAQEIPVGAQSTVHVQMRPDEKQLDEVVVVGYGTQIRQNVTGSIASLSQKDIKDMPITNIGQALEGKIAGLQVQQVSGAPGVSPTFKIRGTGSITAGTGPLIVLDGQALNNGDLSLINPNDIETIDVLKDASATAIYGSRGANGVMMITTKHGKAGKLRINLNYFAGTQDVTKKVDVLNTQQFIDYSIEAFNNGYATAGSPQGVGAPNAQRATSLQYPSFFDNPSGLPDINYQDLIFQQASMSSYQLSASGGGDKVTYSLSGNYTNQDGVVKSSNLKRYSFRSNIDAKLTDRIKIGVNLSPSYTSERVPPTDNHPNNFGTILNALVILPFIPVYQADGTYNSQQSMSKYGFSGWLNPVANLTEINTHRNTTRLLGNLYGEWNIFDKLTYRISFGSDITQQRVNNFQTSKLPTVGQLPPSPATGYTTSDQNVNWIFNQTLNYKKTFNNVHNIETLVGMDVQSNTYDYSYIAGTNFPNDNVTTLNAAGSISAFTSTREEWALESYFARVTYDYKSKYLINISLRTDGSSRFGANKRFGTFPAVSAGWNINEETFLKESKFISTLKIKGSYGLAGNNAFGNYAQRGLLSKAQYVYGNTLANGLAPSSLANNNLTWEKSEQADIGLEAGFFNDRIVFTVDYYNRITNGLLLQVPVPSLTGFTSALQNIGKVRNRGAEFSLNTQNLTGHFKWTTDANISLNRNTVLALGPTGAPLIGAPAPGTIFPGVNQIPGLPNNVITAVGEPIANFYGYHQIGIFQNQAELDSYPHVGNSQPGDVKLEDVNGDKKIDANDQTNIGNNQPKFIYGLTNTFSYKGFDFAFTLQGVQGNQILNWSRRFLDALQGNQNQLTIVLNRWRSESNPGNGMEPRANSKPTGMSNGVTSRWVEDGSYLNIRNVTLGYTLPTGPLSKVFIRTIRFYAGVQNAHIFTKYLGFNPEVTTNFDSAMGSNTQTLGGGIDYGGYPLARTFTFGINIGF